MVAIEWTRGRRAFMGQDGLAAVGLVAAAAALAFPRWALLRGLAPPCLFLHLTGVPCGTCGFTRAFVRAIHGDLPGALSVSPFGALLFCCWLVASLWIAAGWFAPRLRLFPHLRPTDARGRFLLRFGLPLAFLLNWAYLIAFTLALGAPPP